MLISRGGYVIVNLGSMFFGFSQAEITYKTEYINDTDITNNLLYAYKVGKPIALTNIKGEDENGVNFNIPIKWSTINKIIGTNTYEISGIIFNADENTLKYGG